MTELQLAMYLISDLYSFSEKIIVLTVTELHLAMYLISVHMIVGLRGRGAGIHRYPGPDAEHHP